MKKGFYFLLLLIPGTGFTQILDSTLLPIIIINTNGQVIKDDPRITVDMGIIDNGPGNYNHPGDSLNSFNSDVSIEIRGSTSQMYPKKSYAFTPVDSFGNVVNVSILGCPAENDWILYAPYPDKTLLRNTLAYYLANRMGHYASRTRFAELILNNNYKGVYELQERVKRDNDRVAIAPLTPIDTIGDNLTGGYIIKIDKTTGSGTELWYSSYDSLVFFQYHDPEDSDLVAVQKNYIRNYVDLFETALMSPGFTDPDSGYRHYAAESSFIDFMLLQELGRTVDGYRSSCFIYKDRDSNGGKLTMGPMWDFNLSYGNANYCDSYVTSGYQYQFNSICDGFFPHVPGWWTRLLEDTLYADHLKCRWKEVRQTFLSTDSINAWIDSVALQLEEPQDRNFTVWQIMGEYVDWNYFVGETYAEEINYLKDWIADRASWLDDNLPGNCVATGIAENAGLGSDITVFPNPSSTHTTFQIHAKFRSESFEIVITDAVGREWMRRSFAGFETTITTSSFPQGMYLYSIISNEKIVANGQLMIQ
jgi:hypothetical protein